MQWANSQAVGDIVATMVTTRIHHKGRRRLYLREHRKFRKEQDHKWTVAFLADKLGLHEKSVSRIEREPWRLETDEDRDSWAAALGLESRDALFSPPGQPVRASVDRILEDAPPEIHAAVADLAKRLVGGMRR